MEHRNGERNRVALLVSLQQGDRHLGWFGARDVSPGGMSLHGSVANLANNSIITVSIELPRFDTVTTQSFKALVIHQKGGSLGLMWVEQHPDLNELLPVDACLAA